MFGFAFQMALLPVLGLVAGVKWMVRRYRRKKLGFRSMAVPAFPHQRPPPDAALSRVGLPPDGPRPLSGGGVMVNGAAGAGAGVSAPVDPAATDQARRAEQASPYEEANGDPDYVLASFHTREGDGFRIIFHFQLKRQEVRRAVWLDFNRLAKRMGRDKAWAMRGRLGHGQMRFAVDQPTRPWGRIELPTAWLAVDSTRVQKARTFMLDTLDAVNAMIEDGGMDLVSGKHKAIPAGDPRPTPESLAAAATTGSGKPTRKPRGAQAELFVTAPAGGGSGSVLPPQEPPSGGLAHPYQPAPPPDRSDPNAGLPAGVVPEHVCTGFLAATGVTERTDSNGKQYRIFYADVDVDGRLQRLTGADLERALVDARASVGMKMRLQHLGYVPVNGGRHKRKVWNAVVLPD